MPYTLGTAAKAAGKSKATISRAIARGSPTGSAARARRSRFLTVANGEGRVPRRTIERARQRDDRRALAPGMQDSSEMAVALRSRRTLTTVPSRIRRTMS